MDGCNGKAAVNRHKPDRLRIIVCRGWEQRWWKNIGPVAAVGQWTLLLGEEGAAHSH